MATAGTAIVVRVRARVDGDQGEVGPHSNAGGVVGDRRDGRELLTSFSLRATKEERASTQRWRCASATQNSTTSGG
jgi:hypothetical protein